MMTINGYLILSFAFSFFFFVPLPNCVCVGSTLASGWEVREKEKVSSTVLVISWADSLTIYHKRVLNGQQKHNLFSLEATPT